MKRIVYITALAAFYIFSGCREEERLIYMDESDTAPAPITIKGNPVSIPGGAIIKYQIPNDEHLLGVKAVYERNGEICETKASLYKDSLVIEGYGDTDTHDVNIYSIGRNEKLSVPLKVEITPLTPSVDVTVTDLAATFGGVEVSFSDNLSRENLALVLLVDSTGNGIWQPLRTFYTSAVSGRFYGRGLAPKEMRFAVYLRDRWNNKSDTLTKLLTPFEEVRIPPDRFKNAKLPTDFYEPSGGNSTYVLEGLWNGQTYATSYSGAFCTPNSTPIPFHFTIELGRTAIINRFKIYPHSTGIYTNSFVRFFELWGTDEPPLDGSFDNWHKIGDWEIFKPSGYGEGAEVGTVTDEDRNYITSGGDYNIESTAEIPNPFIPIKYLRFKLNNTFETYRTGATQAYVVLAELELWGKIVEE
ncbi:MAG: DUF4959 domain-containing protein [Tannerella sp.]|nr:DUF4959 domain-containing protein [Tannerella sp.]